MLLKYLQLHGFKSFPDKIKIDFDKGFTVVVGPNGSGKSNISDAIRWVMGEQSTKNLRGEKMEDVIFSGTKLRKSQSFAEVTLCIDNITRGFNIDSDEVSITRKYYRNGDSDYLINGNNVRLRDINELFMDTGLGRDGYSMIGQGKIAEIVRSKSNERREIFEEAAGISRFRYRKNEAEKQLSNAEENLIRLRDILGEIEARVEPLKEQSEKANKFLELAALKKELEISILIDALERSNINIKDQSDRLLAATLLQQEIDEKIEQVELNITKTAENMQLCLVDMDSMRSKKSEIEADIATNVANILVCENTTLHNIQSINRLEKEIELYTTDDATILATIEQKQLLIKEQEIQKQVVDNSEREIKEQLEQNISKSSVTEVNAVKLSDGIQSLTLSQARLSMMLRQNEDNLDELKAEFSNNETYFESKKNELVSIEAELGETNDFIKTLASKNQELMNDIAGYKLKLQNKNARLIEQKEKLSSFEMGIKESEQKIKLLQDLEHNMDGFTYSVKEIMSRVSKGILTGVVGTVAQLVEVPSEYTVALETAIGGGLQNIVVENEGNAKSCINLLQREKLGRATFLPITAVKGNTLTIDGLEQYSGFIGIASKLIGYDKKISSIVEYLLGRVVVVDDIDTAIAIAKKNNYKFKIVTIDGQVVNAGGSFTGGSKQKGSGILSRKTEIESLRLNVVQRRTEFLSISERFNDTQRELLSIKAIYDGISAELITINEDTIRADGEYKRLTEQKLAVNNILDGYKKEIEQRITRKVSIVGDIEALKEQLSLTKIELSKKSNELALILDTKSETIKQATILNEKLTSISLTQLDITKNIELLVHSIDELNQKKEQSNMSTERLSNDIAELVAKNEAVTKEIEQIAEDNASLKEQSEQIMRKIESESDRRMQLEKYATELRKAERELSDEKNKQTMILARLDEKLVTIKLDYDDKIKVLWDEYELTRTEASKLAKKIDNIATATTQLNVYKNSIRSLGNVNVAAIEEYKEVSQRYEFLSGQINDAVQSKTELMRLINELLCKMKDIFTDSFNQISKNFAEIFKQLFDGGTAELRLTEPENILESGIEIYAQPPGKIIKSLASLSGGEQTFIAIAIYFAILKVRPAPFCVLDEIEAALDDVNVDKYAKYLKTLCSNTQFIAISHRRGTMEEADMLYGVTMQDEGVSKLLRLNISEIAQANK